MNFANVLRNLGAEERELSHLLACGECSVWNGYDGAELERCPENPIRVERRWLDDLTRLGWGLMAVFEVPKPPKGAFERALDAALVDYKQALVEQMGTPFFADHFQRMTRIGS